jgi:hypothetical protein
MVNKGGHKMTIQTTIEAGSFSVYRNGEYIGAIQQTGETWEAWNKEDGRRAIFETMEAAKSVFREREARQTTTNNNNQQQKLF